MYKKTAGLLAAAISAAALTVGAPAANATEDFPPYGCDVSRYSLLFGEGVSMTCFSLAAPSQTYRVVAHCASGSSYWYTVGHWVPLGFGPSTAECHGALLMNAYVAGYHVDDF
ncbi:hypothetical protein SAMN05421504_1011171 [Amycolatopsis xylanica]|uniref:Uncharacterized protein n=1 Tax=Amycolatopsis xylanica TaxID=589385 RepID=A0A1H2VBD8_9PSEU|nr:hypothetical protein [Amycolatopsis xylanica]SDW65668.1 hypothetical protein SAMN05421504_1011171 [Amycolatopsis xylanica]